MAEIDEFQIVAITRDLVRRPDILHVARVLSMLAGKNEPTPSPVYVLMAKNLIDNPVKRETLTMALDLFGKK